MVNTAPPPLPELRLHKFSLRARDQKQSKYALRSSILRMICDLPVNRPNRADYEMLFRSGIRVERCLFKGNFFLPSWDC